MKRTLILVLTLLSLASARAQETLQFVVRLNGLNEAPPNSSPYKGVGGFTRVGSVLDYGVDLPLVSGLTPTGAGIYGPASAMTNGDLIFDWPNYEVVLPVPNSTFGGALRYSGSYALTAEQIGQLNAGLWYVNIKTTNFPDGELRGQICPQTPDSDCDGDGVPNGRDLCPDTPPGVAVDANGCSIEQLCPCSGPWKEHREYVKCVRDEAFRFWKEGRIAVAQRNAIVKEAEQSSCGNPLPAPTPGPFTPGAPRHRP